MAGGFATLGAICLLASVILPVSPIPNDVPLTPAHQALTVLPENAAVVSDDSAIFHCASDSSEINWFFGSVKLVDRCVLNPSFEGNYSVEHNPITGACNLNVLGATRAQEGTYICVEADGFESELLSAHLVVIDNLPHCTVTPYYDIGVGDEVIMSCTATFTPNLSPMLMTWTDPEGQRVPSTEDFSQPGRIVSSINFTATPPSVTIHTCTASFGPPLSGPSEAANAPAWTHAWNSSEEDVKHNCPTNITINTPNSNLSALFVGDILTCWAEGAPSIVYDWSVDALSWGTYRDGAAVEIWSAEASSFECRAVWFVDYENHCRKSKTVNITASYATSCLKRKQANVNAASGRYTIRTNRGQNIEVYCEMGINGGGYTFINPQYLPLLTDGEVQALITDHSTYLMRSKRSNGTQPYAVISQLHEYSHVPLKIGFSSVPSGYRMDPFNANAMGTPYLFYGLLPTSETYASALRGMRVNDVDVAFNSINVPPGDEYNYMALFPGFNAQTWYDSPFDYDEFFSLLFSSHRAYPSGRLMPDEFFMFFEAYFYNPVKWAHTNGQLLHNLDVISAAIGFR